VKKTRLRTASLILLAFLAVAGIPLVASDSVRFVVCSAVGALVYGFPSPGDRAELEMIQQKIVSVHHFTHNSLSRPEELPVFGNAGSKMLLTLPAEIGVYDVQDRAEQDKIAAALKELAMEKRFKPFKLCFYDHENWIVEGNLGSRGPETQLRCLRIAADRIRDVSGQKLITYPTP
jgi:hypothetical protein